VQSCPPESSNTGIAMAMHINPAHKGKFTEKVTGSKTGKLTDAGVQKGLHAKSGLERKEANFARMARRHFKPLGDHLTGK